MDCSELRRGRGRMNFNKPPVVEAWIEFKVGLAEESRGWDEKTANAFIQEYFAEFKHIDFLGVARLAFDSNTRQISPPALLFERIRAFTESRDRCVQAGRNVLIFNQIRQNEWPGYEKLQDDAFDALNKYLKFRGLSTLVGVSLSYRDIVAIPESKDVKIKLEDYFAVHPTIPDVPFGEISGFRVAMELPRACKNGIMTVSIQTLPMIKSSMNEYRFAVDWHVGCDGRIPDTVSAKQWLEEAHRDMKSVFEAAFTQRTLDIFEPKGV